MKFYLVIDEDRHCDVGVEVYQSKFKAIDRAKEIALAGSRAYPKDYEEIECSGCDWIFDVTYSGEGDHVHVEEAGLKL